MMKILNMIFNGLFPETCSHCRENRILLYRPLCEKCLQKIQPIKMDERCDKCGDLKNNHRGLCQKRKFFFQQGLFIWAYKGESKRVLKMAKFQERKSAISYLKKQMPALIWNRFQEGENTAVLMMCSSRKFLKQMSKFISKQTCLPVYEVFRKNKSKLQSKLLHVKDRYIQIEENLVLDLPGFQKMTEREYSQYLIVDDVWTSGATLNFAAKLLKDNGIPEQLISVLAFFKTDQIRHGN